MAWVDDVLRQSAGAACLAALVSAVNAMVLGFYSGYYWLHPRPIMGYPVVRAH